MVQADITITEDHLETTTGEKEITDHTIMGDTTKKASEDHFTIEEDNHLSQQ